MFDIRWIRANPEAFDAALARRGLPPQSADLIRLDEQRREVIVALNAAQERRNAASKEIGKAKAQKDEARAQELMAEVANLKGEIQEGEAREREAEAALRQALSGVPNLPRGDVPLGEDEHDNQPYRPGDNTRPAKPTLSFRPKEHFELGEASGQMDFEVAAKLSGSRFVVLKSELARLERAIGQFMLDLHTEEHGYTEVQPPFIVGNAAMEGTAQLPKFEEDQFEVVSDLNALLGSVESTGSAPVERVSSRKWLIPTAEVPLTNLVRESILSEEELPLRFTALTPCFRAEAGSAGRDTRGMLRQRQFNKVEMVSITTPESSTDEHERMLTCAEEVLKRLGLHYRVMTLCTGDMGFGSQKTYDIEVWLPGQDTYREITSVSVCGDFQARRMEARYRPAGEKQPPRYVHTLNGSGVAVGRALIAVMENYQQEDGSIRVPEALQPYMRGKTSIGARS